VRRALQSEATFTEAEARRLLATCLQARSVLLAAKGHRARGASCRTGSREAQLALAPASPGDAAHEDRVIQGCNALAIRYEVTRAAAHRAKAIAAHENALKRFGKNGPSASSWRPTSGFVARRRHAVCWKGSGTTLAEPFGANLGTASFS
jgi:hypothetical protein